MWKEVLDTVYRGKVPDSANGSSQNITGSSLIRCHALGRPAGISHPEEQNWNPTLCLQGYYCTYSIRVRALTGNY